jgi:23S rRNA (adenine2503-C2)-methyltransferase
MVGCPVGCLFCATGKLGFKRNLNSWEIIEQVLFFQRYLKSQNKQVTNIVFMGMGEPLLNFSEVQKAIKIINDTKGLNIGARHISISTVGVPGGISKLSQVPLQINLAVSLHAPNNELRSRLIPINKDYPLTTILKDAADYVKKTKRKVMFEYIMIKDVNDSDQNAHELVKLMNNYLYFVNLIRYNKTAVFQPSNGETIKRFKTILEQKGINITQRYHFGGEIKAACGQLAGEDSVFTPVLKRHSGQFGPELTAEGLDPESIK